MAKIVNRVLLGYEDESVTDKYRSLVNFTTNKVGGRPDWPGESPVTSVTCKLCGLNVPLVLQVYAPLENSPYHRTLYIFACINPNCWNQNGSWICLRSQVLETKCDGNTNGGRVEMSNTDWCSGGDCWGDEENGNTIEVLSNRGGAGGLGGGDREVELSRRGLACMTMEEEDEEEEPNANQQHCGRGGGGEGAIGCLATATATIEGDEGEVVSIDTPTIPQTNLLAMLEEAAPLPQVPILELEFSPFFVSVGEEDWNPSLSPTGSDHLREMLKEYQLNNSALSTPDEDQANPHQGGDMENYEKSLPPHGDKYFHNLVTRIHANPGHFLRYGGDPLLLYPLQEKAPLCGQCRGELKFELQILPTLIPKLRLSGNPDDATHLEFGSVFLYACRNSCWLPNDKVKEELLIVQVEKM